MRQRKIWLLTGLVVLNNATRSEVNKRHKGLKLGISPEAVAALCGAPVGFSIDVGTGMTAKVEAQLGGKLVYAAKYQQLQTAYKAWEGNDALADNEFELHPDLSSRQGTSWATERKWKVALRSTLRRSTLWMQKKEILTTKHWMMRIGKPSTRQRNGSCGG